VVGSSEKDGKKDEKQIIPEKNTKKDEKSSIPEKDSKKVEIKVDPKPVEPVKSAEKV